MSEANTPSNPGLPELTPPSDWEEIALEKQLSAGEASPNLDVWDDWETVDFPDAIRIDALVSGTASDPAAPAADAADRATEPPPVEELIHLIQELNQCNTLLLDRVAQLEAALVQSDRALQAEQSRCQAIAADAQALASTQERVTQLLKELEFAQQTSQRQQILVETLTGQLETSQERVAQLERECVLVQQRYSEQAQQLMESETACRDLRSRLQRQQRYTLQFKAALDKCLDVPPPSYETAAAAVALREPVSVSSESPAEAIGTLAAQPFLPKVARIQPWTSQPRFDLNLNDPDMERFSIDRLRAVSVTEQQLNHVQSGAVAAEPPETAAAIDLDFAADDGTEAAAIDISARLDQQIATAAQQLADFPLAAIEQAADSTLAPDLSAEPEDDALWQNLAQLIDVSTEDVVRASQADSFAEFEPQSADTQPQIDPTDTIAAAVQKSLHLPVPPADSSSAAPPAAPPAPPPALQSNWPSPVVYPLRPTRKLNSIAAVDLPTFPKAQLD